MHESTTAFKSVASLFRLLTVATAIGMAGTIYLPWFTGGQREPSLYDVTFHGGQLPYTYVGFMLAALTGVFFASLAGGASGRNEASWARARGAFFGAALMPAANFFFEDKITGIEPLKLGTGVWLCAAAAAIGIVLSSISVLASRLDDGGPPATHAAGVFSGFAWGMIATLYGLVLLEVIRQTSSGFLELSASNKKEAYGMVLSQTATVAIAGAIPTLLWIMRVGSRPTRASYDYSSRGIAAAQPEHPARAVQPSSVYGQTQVAAADVRSCQECGAPNGKASRFCAGCGAASALSEIREGSRIRDMPSPQHEPPSASVTADAKPEQIPSAPEIRADTPLPVEPTAEAVGEGMADTAPTPSGTHATSGQQGSDSLGSVVVQPVVKPAVGYEVRARYNGVVVWTEVQRRDRELERVSAGAEMTVVGEAGAYLEVELLSGQRGFVAGAGVARL